MELGRGDWGLGLGKGLGLWWGRVVDQMREVGKVVNDNRAGFVVGLSDLGLGMWETMWITRG